jgi:hypothetical protein
MREVSVNPLESQIRTTTGTGANWLASKWAANIDGGARRSSPITTEPHVGGSSSAVPTGGSNLSMSAARASPAVTWPMAVSQRDSQTRSEPWRPNEECRNPSKVAREVTDPVRI